ncbi:IPT/TIG domain-containing protein [Dictyostelium discoideum AX4]|uniref:IPT/TIG domain-containing protein n=1 Tax=Dictyostelium discoideum TaxID=44689 RepID=Q54R85_DICDI|nr:IPT/TIG domain-containing protein [Dictyostelium discoideum AX4]EAL65799.1 IPT/TIG domain-containing protein [Dictyostelium discoideum AX4]|eukprot:XP_639162.1 IPT/TIG domain-containing protein [Dictyostelium discoideum AX4]
MKIILLFVIFFLISKIFSQNLVYPIGYETHMDSLVVKYKGSDIYYTNISFIWNHKSRYDMSFNCVLNDTIRICTLPVKESDREQMYSEELLACTARNGIFVMCGFDVHLGFFPSPLLISPFKPKTRGGNTTLSGYYLELKERVFVIFENNYEQDQYYGSNNYYRVVGYFETNTPDRINLTLRVYPGCGNRTIIWENGETYNFTYQDPNIEKIDINQSILNITGTNFYNQSVFVAVKIDNNIIDPNDIISVDFENIKLKFNYSDPFSSKLNVQVGCCDYWSNKFQITYPPIPSSVNSIPKLKGGLLIINGNRLTSSPSSNNNNISVTVGDSICSIFSSSSNEIKCNLQPLSNSTLNNSSPITVSINGVENTNKLLLYYDIPHIKTYSQVNNEIHIIGSCFGNINSTHIQINGKQAQNQIKSINNDETVLILKVQNQIYNFNISIESNSINVDVKLYAIINEIPSVGNKFINFTLLYVNSSNINSIATIKILNEQLNQTIQSTLTTFIESVVLCSFLIENLCGIVNYEIEIGHQRFQSSFSYESPLINKCNLNSNEIVTCIGKGFVNSNETIIIISNQSITFNNESNNNNDKSISFQMNEEYILGELYLDVCGLLSNKVKIDTIPIFKNVSIPNLFDTNGGEIIIFGKYLNNNTNITIECNNEVIEKECKSYNSTSLECNIEFNGPNDKTCKLLFNNIDNNNNNNNIVSTFNIIYKSPSINQTSIINLKQGGILTIIGNDFYYPIDKVTIIGNNGNCSGCDILNCNEAKYINDTMITCFIQATNNTFSNIKNGEMIFINVTTNGKSGISKVFKYLTQSDDSHQYSDARNIFQNLLLSILIILIISLLFISNI